MKRFLAIFLSIVLLTSLLVGCGSEEDHIGEARTPSASSVQHGRDYQDVLEDFEEKGFINIQLEKIPDLITGWLTKDGEVEEVSVDGSLEYRPDVWYPNDVKVVISYHTFPEKTADAEEETSNDSDNTANVSSDEVENESSTPNELEILTIDNCPDLKAVLSMNADISDDYADFSNNYYGKTIEFDGSIDYMDNAAVFNPFTGETTYSEYGYDLLLSAGDYSDSSQCGPTFKIEDVRSRDIGGDAISKTLPDFISTGSNVHIQATVGRYDSEHGIFYLNYKNIVAR